MEIAHLLLAYASIAVVVAGGGWSIALILRREPGGPRFEQLQAAVVAILVVGAASGLMTLAAGRRPADGIHLMYAAIAIGLIPLARSFFGRTGGRRAAMLALATFGVLGAIVYRLFTTG